MDLTRKKPSPSEKLLIAGPLPCAREKSKGHKRLTHQSPKAETSLSVKALSSLHEYVCEVVGTTEVTGVISAL